MRNARLAVRLIVVIVAFCAVKPSGVRGQTALAITVTNTPAAITTTTSAAYFILVENSSSPSALWSVSIMVNGVTQTPVYEPAGAQFVFMSRSTRYAAGTLLGYVQSASPGPYNFVLLQYDQAPAGTVTNTTGALGAGMILLGNGGSDIKGTPNLTYDPKAGTTFTTPLLSAATILGISNNGTTSTMTCDIPGCGLTAGGPLESRRGIARELCGSCSQHFRHQRQYGIVSVTSSCSRMAEAIC